MIARVEDRWPPDRSTVPADALDQLVLASRLLGADRAVASFGSGNTSAKAWSIDHTGRQVRTLWVKGSGRDLASLERRDVTGLRLNEIEPLFLRDEMPEAEMAAYLSQCMLDPAMPPASIETLLHAFIRAEHVDLTHPDAIGVLAGTRDGERLVAECFGDEAAWIPYVGPRFELAKLVGRTVRGDERLKLVVLAKQGLVVWGDSAAEAYHRTIEAINRAAAFVEERTAGIRRFGGPAGPPLGDREREALLTQALPAIRGAVGRERPKVLTVDTSEPVLELVGAADAPQLTSAGAASPDHLAHTNGLPLWVPFDPRTDDAAALAARVRERAAAYRDDARASTAESGQGDRDPRVVLIQRVGLVAAGTSPQASALSRDLYHRAIEVMAGAHALGGFTPLTPAESRAVESRPPELGEPPAPPGELQGRVAVVTGAAGAVGRAVVDALGAAGACVVAFDANADAARDAVARLGDRALAVAGDGTSEEAVEAAFAAAVARYGGVDVLVCDAGVGPGAPIEQTTLEEWQRRHAGATGAFLASRAAFGILRRQDTGGSIVLVGGGNAGVAGLARRLADEGAPHRIRVNAVGGGAVPHPGGVAQAVLQFASPTRSPRTTGSVLDVG